LLAPVPYLLKDQQFWLTAERCLYWEAEKALIVSDLHFGKTGHFRKSGIPVPTDVYKEDLQRLLQQIQFFKPDSLIIVGDLFHSRSNLEHSWFKRWRHDMPMVDMHLVIGNHDILHPGDYAEMGLQVHQHELSVKGFSFVHDLQPEQLMGSRYYISGHIHPGIRLSGIGKQALRFPCFYFTSQFAVLPAFSGFTGISLIEPKKGENVFAIVENKLISIC
jgi:DNA ligase-associated metallophosphoesterase